MATEGHVSIKPRVLPRDAVDVLIGLPHGLVFGIVIPMLASYGLAMALWYLGLGEGALFGALCFWLGVGALGLCWTVRRLVLQPNGIRFVRVVGNPKLVPWSEILEIAPAPRSEVVRLGWLTFPFADASHAMTAKGHYRIRFRSGLQYFPPNNPNAFEEAVRRYRDAAQPSIEADEAR